MLDREKVQDRNATRVNEIEMLDGMHINDLAAPVTWIISFIESRISFQALLLLLHASPRLSDNEFTRKEAHGHMAVAEPHTPDFTLDKNGFRYANKAKTMVDSVTQAVPVGVKEVVRKSTVSSLTVDLEKSVKSLRDPSIAIMFYYTSRIETRR